MFYVLPHYIFVCFFVRSTPRELNVDFLNNYHSLVLVVLAVNDVFKNSLFLFILVLAQQVV